MTTKNVELSITPSDRELAQKIAESVLAMVEERKKDPTALPPAPVSALFSAAMSGVQSERLRISTLLEELGKEAAIAMHQHSGLETAARLAGDEAGAKGIAADKQTHAIIAKTFILAIEAIARDPNACQACRGTRKVPSRLSGGAEVPCELCAPVNGTPS